MKGVNLILHFRQDGKPCQIDWWAEIQTLDFRHQTLIYRRLSLTALSNFLGIESYRLIVSVL